MVVARADPDAARSALRHAAVLERLDPVEVQTRGEALDLIHLKAIAIELEHEAALEQQAELAVPAVLVPLLVHQAAALAAKALVAPVALRVALGRSEVGQAHRALDAARVGELEPDLALAVRVAVDGLALGDLDAEQRVLLGRYARACETSERLGQERADRGGRQRFHLVAAAEQRADRLLRRLGLRLRVARLLRVLHLLAGLLHLLARAG